jgi:hypothetical protein
MMDAKDLPTPEWRARIASLCTVNVMSGSAHARRGDAF